MLKIDYMLGFGGGVSGGGTGAVNFDGNTWLSRGADLTSVPSTNYWTFSFWYKFDSTTDTTVYENKAEKVVFANAAVWQIESKGPDTVNDGYEGLDTDLTNWHHTCGMINTGSADDTHYYRDDTEITPQYKFGSRDGTNYVLTSTDHFLFRSGGPGAASRQFEGSIYEFWMDWGQNIDLTNTTQRRKFINADLTPPSLGANGETPTGTSPEIYMTGGAATFATNLGTGGAFSVGSGALIEAGKPTTANSP